MRNRPDVRMAENALIAKNAAIGQAVAELFPNVSIGGVLGWQAKHFSGLGSSSAAAYGFTPAVSLPLFNFGQLINQVKLNREVKEEYVYLYKNTLLGAVEEVKTRPSPCARNMSVIRRCQSRCATCSGCFLPCATNTGKD